MGEETSLANVKIWTRQEDMLLTQPTFKGFKKRFTTKRGVMSASPRDVQLRAANNNLPPREEQRREKKMKALHINTYSLNTMILVLHTSESTAQVSSLPARQD